MIKIINDKGDSVYAVGQEGSRARIFVTYPSLIEKYMARITCTGINAYSKMEAIDDLERQDNVSDYNTRRLLISKIWDGF
mgnify:CR=1 FL=1